MHPAAPVLHYGMCCFEGMKAYLGVDGRGRLFRSATLGAMLSLACSSTVQVAFNCRCSEIYQPMLGSQLAILTCRPDMNMQRLHRSSRRLLLADYDPGLLPIAPWRRNISINS